MEKAAKSLRIGSLAFRPLVFIGLMAVIGLIFGSCKPPTDDIQEPVPVSSVTLNKATLNLTVGGVETLIAAIQPGNADNKSVSWTSSNAGFASVSNGTVSAHAAGSATITVTTADGGKTASCVVTVFDGPLPNQNPIATDFDISNLTQIAGSVIPVTITPKLGKSSGAITIYYNGSTLLPTVAGTYTVTFNVAAAAGWNAASGLAGGTLSINNQNPIATDFDIGNLTQTAGSVIPVTITPKLGKSSGAITIYYNGSTLLPTVAGTYTVTFNVSATTGWNAANGLNGGTLSINNQNPIATDFDIGNLTQIVGSVIPVTITPKTGKSTGAITIYYNGSTALPSAVGSYTVTFNVEAAAGWNAASGLTGGTLSINNIPLFSVTGVTLDQTTLNLLAGGSTTLVASVLPENATIKDVSWTSTNSNVAIITDGEVFGVAPGSATIFVTTVDGNKTATCNVMVFAVAVTGVTLNESAITLTISETAQLVEMVSPNNATNKNVNWSSSNNSVASVSNGVVSANAAGTAIITVSTADGAKTAICVVTVARDAQTPVIIAQPMGGTVVFNALHSLSITANISDGGTLSYRWYSNTNLSNIGGSIISGATSDAYTPPTGTAGTFYYFVEITNTIADNGDGGNKTSSVRSNVAEICVISPSEIVFELMVMNEWNIIEQTAQATANTAQIFTVNGTYESYRWYLDGDLVGTSTSYTFNKQADVYQLVVVVTDNSGESRSGRCRITVK